MFTGLISSTASMVSLEKKNRPVLTIRAKLDQPLTIGASLAVNGVCLTVVEVKQKLYSFNISAETLRISNLGDLPAGAAVNVELPLTLQDFVGGHLVSGHIDGTVRVRAMNKGDQSSRLLFSFSEREWKKFLILRGSVALNGVSLTVSEISNSWFAVEIIPHTLASTNLQFLRIGQRVNVELDLIGKYLYSFYQTKKGRIR
jgi:riboflavin synthase